MTWFWIALAAPAVWGAINYVDKYIVTNYFSGKGVGSLVIFTSLSGAIMAVLILLFNSSSISLSAISAIIIAINGALLVASFIPYLHALEKEEASVISTLFQLTPVFGYFLGLMFLNEHLSLFQIIGSLLIIGGAVTISLNLSKKIQFKLKPFLFMALSSFMIAVNSLVFKLVALQENFWGTAFWEYVGGFAFGAFLFFGIKLYRQQFVATIKVSRNKVLGLNLVSEFMNITAKLLANFAALLAPLALVLAVNGFQPMIVFIYGLILTLFIPKWGKEKISRGILVQKFAAIIIIFVGTYFLFK